MPSQSPGDLYPVRLAFAGDETGRDYAFTKDRYYKNLFIEEYSDKIVIVKRPGLELVPGDCHSGLPGLGLFDWEGVLVSAFGAGIYTEVTSAPIAWTRVADMTTAVHVGYGESVGDDFYSFGGFTSTAGGSAASNTVQKYVKATDTWTTPTTMPQGGRGELIAAKLPNGQIYVGGGTSVYLDGGSCQSQVYWYNPDTNTWTAKNSLPFAWADARVVVLSNGKLLICGGRNAAGAFISAAYLYNHVDDSYTAVTSMTTARSNFAAVVLDDGRVMVIGGHPSGTSSTNSTEIYDPATNTWTATASLPVGVQYESAARAAGNVYVWGGGTTTSLSPVVNTIYAYSVGRNEWTTLVNFPIAFEGAAYDRYDDGIYINAGGYNATDGVSKRTYITTAATECSSIGAVVEGEAGASFTIMGPYNTLIIKMGQKLYTVDKITLAFTTVTDVDYPGDPSNNLTMVPGVAVMDGYVFVMTTQGIIYNSDLETPTSWNALNFINAEIDADDGVAITKHLNYILALGYRSFELFEDVANATGSPLGRIEQAYKPIGCVAAWSVTQIGTVTLWLGRQANDDSVVVALNGFDVTIVSSPVIQRIFKSYGGDLRYTRGVYVPIAGHDFYVLQLGHYWNQFDRTIVYDLGTQKWFEWTTVHDSGEGAINITSSAVVEGETLVSGMFDGNIYRMSPDIYLDNDAVIRFEGRTEPWDSGIAVRKFVVTAKLIGDLQTVAGATIDLDYSDDNYKTFSTARSISLQTLTGVTRLGKTERRAWRVKSTANAPIRLDGIDVVFSPGDYMV